jgi:hypothetical protein
MIGENIVIYLFLMFCFLNIHTKQQLIDLLVLLIIKIVCVIEIFDCNEIVNEL